jgi:hypothetical protein
MFTIAMDRARHDDFEGIASFAHCAYTPRERQIYAQTKMTSLITGALLGDDEFLAMTAASMLAGSLPVRQRSLRRERRFRLPADFCRKVTDSVSEEVIARIGGSSLFAGLAFSWYGIVDQGVLHKYGVAPYFNHPVREGLVDFDGVSGLVILSVDSMINSDKYEKIELKNKLWSIVSISLAVAPFVRSEFKKWDRNLIVPYRYWMQIYEDAKQSPEFIISAIFARNLSRMVDRSSDATARHIFAKEQRVKIKKVELDYLKQLETRFVEAKKLRAILKGEAPMFTAIVD